MIQLIKLLCRAIITEQLFARNANHIKNYSLWGLVSQAATVEIVHTNIKLSCNPFAEQLLPPTLYRVTSVLPCAVMALYSRTQDKTPFVFSSCLAHPQPLQNTVKKIPKVCCN